MIYKPLLLTSKLETVIPIILANDAHHSSPPLLHRPLYHH
jgi:hypothetical protein